MGAVPGLTATMAVALITPMTYFLGPVHAMAAVVTLEAFAIFAGDIPNALVRIPGTPASAAYTDDAYALARSGGAERVLGTFLVFSVAGGLFGVLLLASSAQALASLAARFSFVEYFWFYLIGLGCAVTASRGRPLKGALALVLGLLLSTVGLSPVHSAARFAFGVPELYQGINFIPAMIGLFGFSEVLRNLRGWSAAAASGGAEAPSGTGAGGTGASGVPPRPPVGWLAQVFAAALPDLWRRKLAFLRSAGVGALVGMLPGAGADIAAWVASGLSRRLSRRPSGSDDARLEAVSDATTANSASLAGAWVPALVFGIPGDSVTALVIGILMMKNLRPGPEIFERQGALVYGIYILFALANLVLIPAGFLAIKAGGALVRVPRCILLPAILLFCVLGSYAINGSYFDVGVMLALGVLGFALERWEVPVGPVVLGVVLGGPLEEAFLQTMARSGGSLLAFFERPIAALLGTLCLGLWLSPWVRALAGRVRGNRAARETPGA
ncbi:MAG: tripartite tricarboxylate transporter permease [Planctomycetes bacterium]|nr:tripartite tricarboxylate transporter permease [Planctomycetota bacterium]